MSSYLLLRNNQESGPFTLEELKAGSLKSFDLIWVVGKSAAWRYPGEILELKLFAPPLPDQAGIGKRLPSENTASRKSFDSAVGSENIRVSSRSVYVNLPSDKRVLTSPPVQTAASADWPISEKLESSASYLNTYSSPSKTVSVSGNILWIATVVLLFGAGILTGFFISDRRKYFTTDEIHTQIKTNQPVNSEVKSDENATRFTNNLLTEKSGEILVPASDTVNSATLIQKNITSLRSKKSSKLSVLKNDTSNVKPVIIPAMQPDSVVRTTTNKNEILFQKLKLNPENYIDLQTGRYTTGVFGGISSFPLTVTNNAPVVVDQVDIRVDYFLTNGKLYKSELLSYYDLQAGESLTLKTPKSPRGIKITTHLQRVDARQADLHYQR